MCVRGHGWCHWSAPAQGRAADLRRGTTGGCCDALHRLVREVVASTERTVRLGDYGSLLRALEQRATVLERTELHLIDDRRNGSGCQHVVQLTLYGFV